MRHAAAAKKPYRNVKEPLAALLEAAAGEAPGKPGSLREALHCWPLPETSSPASYFARVLVGQYFVRGGDLLELGRQPLPFAVADVGRDLVRVVF